jgi:tetratricopeptide (TPR) repeat protein
MSKIKEINNNLITVENNLIANIEKTTSITDKLLTEQVQKDFNKAFCLMNNIDFKTNTLNYYLLFESQNDLGNINNIKFAEVEVRPLINAIHILDSLIEVKPLCAILYIMRGICKSKISSWEEGSIKDLNKGIEIESTFEIAYNYRGNVKSDMGDLFGAIDDYNRALEISPKYAFCLFNRGIVKLDLIDYEGAKADFDKAEENGLKIALVYKQMGICRALNADWEDSIQYFSKAIEMTPEDEHLLHWRASAYASSDKYIEAIGDCERILKINPKFQEVIELRDESIRLSKT